MSAIGELIIWMIYVMLCIPPLAMMALLIFRDKKFVKKGLVYFILAAIPLTLFSYNQYSNHREAELAYVGTYYLTKYPNCDACILTLKKNNSYSVTNQKKEVEHGAWGYRSGGDYWIVDIGAHGQLGTGNYSYSESENNFKKCMVVKTQMNDALGGNATRRTLVQHKTEA